MTMASRFLFPSCLFLLAGLTEGRLTAGSKHGRKLLDQAKVVVPSTAARELGEGGNHPELSSMTIEYTGCSTYSQWAKGNWVGNGEQYDQYNDDYDYGEENANDDAEQNNDWWYWQMQAENDGVAPSNLVRFTLCQTSSCGACSGEYVIDMESFMEVYTEWKMEHDYFWCERVRENCVCNNNYSWQECYSSCFAQHNLSYEQCLEASGNNGNNNVFQIQQYLQCKGIKFYNPNYMYRNGGGGYNFNWNNFYYLGLTCEENANVMLRAFYDQDCSYPADDSAVQNAMGDYNSIPYLAGTPVLSLGTCIECASQNNYGQRRLEDAEGEEADDNADDNADEGNADEGDADDNADANDDAAGNDDGAADNNNNYNNYNANNNYNRYNNNQNNYVNNNNYNKYNNYNGGYANGNNKNGGNNNGGNGNNNANYNRNNWNDDWAAQPDATDLCNMITNNYGNSHSIVCDEYIQDGCEWIETYLPRLDGRSKFDFLDQISRLQTRLAASRRFQIAFGVLILVLVGTIAFCCSHNFAEIMPVRSRGPRNRQTLLEYRREADGLKKTDSSTMFVDGEGKI